MSALRHPRFRRLLVGESVSSFGDTAMFLSLGVWAKDLTGSNTAAGLVFLFLPGRSSPRRCSVTSPTGSVGGR